MGSISGSGGSPGEGNGNPLRCCRLGNPKNRGAWWATVHGVTEELHTTKRLNNNNKNKNTQFELHKFPSSILTPQIPTYSAVFNWLKAILSVKLSNKGYILCFAENII